jgi:hypothetical protein
LLLMIVGGSGMFAIVVILPTVQTDFAASRGAVDACTDDVRLRSGRI